MSRLRFAAAALAVVAAGTTVAATATPAAADGCGNGRLYKVRYESAYQYQYANQQLVEHLHLKGTPLVGWGGASADGWVPIKYKVENGEWVLITRGADDQEDWFHAYALDFIKCL